MRNSCSDLLLIVPSLSFPLLLHLTEDEEEDDQGVAGDDHTTATDDFAQKVLKDVKTTGKTEQA